jgi:cytochrome c-type biogenesis protein CcmH/NrfF
MHRVVYALLLTGMFIGFASEAQGRTLTTSQIKLYDKVTHELIAPCCWREAIAIHRSAEALQMLDEVEQFVAEGRSEDEIRSVYLARYGVRILADPPGSDGFWLYLVPFGLLCILMVAAVVRLRLLITRTASPRPCAPLEFIAQVRMETEWKP